MQVVQKRGVSQWGLGPYSKPSSPDATLAADSPRPRSPGPEVRPFAARADGFAEPPSLCPAPPSPPPPAPRASAYLALSAAGRGSGRLLSLSRPWGRDCTPNLPPPPTPGPGHPTPLPSSQLQGTELYYSPLGCRHAWTPCRAADLPVSRLGSVPTPHDTALRPSSRDRGDGAAQTRPFSPPLIRSIARGLQRRASRSRGSPYPDSSPSPWGTRSCRTGRSWDSWLREGLGRGRPSSRAFSFPRASWREAAAGATTQ